MDDEFKKLIFIGSDPNTPSPEPSYKKVPQWYRDLARYGESNDMSQLDPINDRGGDGSNVSTKLCMPFFDAMTLGYQYCLSDDLTVTLDIEGKPSLSWTRDIMLVDKRPTVDLAIPSDVHPIHFGIKMEWFYETPPGYSLLMVTPINRPDLPYWVPSGIVDSDIWGLPAFLPMFIKRGFEGTIPAGTPIIQLIPIKREPWELEIDTSAETHEKHDLLSENRRSHVTAHYKKFAWRKKEYTKPDTDVV